MLALHRLPWAFGALTLVALCLTAGCREPYSTVDESFELGNAVPAEFNPPPLAELEAEVEWVEQPVINSIEHLREYQQGLPPPELSVEEALELRNTSPEINDAILRTMGRLPVGEEQVDYGASLERHIAGDVKSTNPLLISSTAEFDVAGLTNFGLFGFDWNFFKFASAASVKSWQSSANGMYDKVVMRDDLYWSDGTPITAHDVEFSYRVIMTDAVPIPAVRSGTDQLLGVKAYNDHTVVFFHKEPLVTNAWNINFPIVPKHVYEETLPYDPTMEKSPAHVKLDRNPVVGGAYQIVKRVPGSEIVLERREEYYTVDGKQVRDKPHFKTIRFKILEDNTTALLALKNGDIEEIQLTPEQWMNQTDTDDFYNRNTKVYDTEWVYFYFGWNCDTVFFKDPKVRWAMSYAFDHQEMLTKHRYGLDEPSTGIFHPSSRWAPNPPPQPLGQDLPKAEQLLAEAGWTDTDGDGILDKEVELNDKLQRVPFEFTMIVSSRPDRIALCSLLADDLDKIGVKCKVLPLEFSTMQERARTHKFQAMFGGWGTGTDPDTAENLWTTEAIEKGRNFVNYSNPEVDRLFKAGKREFDPEKRRAIYQQIHLLLWDDQPYTWLFFQNSYFAFNKELRGYNFSPRGPYNYGPGFDAIWKPAE